MITKILFTLLIMIAAVLYIRHTQGQGRQQRQREVERQAQQAADRRHAWRVAIALVSLTLVSSAGLFYSHWMEQHRLFSVKLTNSHSGAVESYRAYQRDIDGRSFRTTDGRLINLSDSERMEVEEEREE
jgi:ABC-type Fe3+ transport system permease subunit